MGLGPGHRLRRRIIVYMDITLRFTRSPPFYRPAAYPVFVTFDAMHIYITVPPMPPPLLYLPDVLGGPPFLDFPDDDMPDLLDPPLPREAGMHRRRVRLTRG